MRNEYEIDDALNSSIVMRAYPVMTLVHAARPRMNFFPRWSPRGPHRQVLTRLPVLAEHSKITNKRNISCYNNLKNLSLLILARSAGSKPDETDANWIGTSKFYLKPGPLLPTSALGLAWLFRKEWYSWCPLDVRLATARKTKFVHGQMIRTTKRRLCDCYEYR